LGAAPNSYAELSELYAFYHTDRRGSSSDQPLETLALWQQSNSQDDWDTYLEFAPESKGYTGYFLFDVPEGVDVDEVENLELRVNYRGPLRSFQRWYWQLRDYAAGRWVTLGDNRSAGDWVWSELRMPVPGDPGDYLDRNGRFKLRYRSKTDEDASQIDYLAMRMTTNTKPVKPQPPGDVWRPSPGTTWQWQLSGSIDTSHDVAMYDIDLFDATQGTIDQLQAAGRIVICYFSAGSWEDWRPDSSAFPASLLGRGNGWPGERWLDIRALEALSPVMLARLDLAVSKGCDGVEPDNIDGYSNNTGFPLSANDQLVYNRWLAEQAHARCLSIGLKNDLEQVDALEPWFDWALNEQCFHFNECELLQPFIDAGKAVFGVEYSGDPANYCRQANALNYDWLIKNNNINLGPGYESCR
jgi:hypothetical protein